MAWASLNGNTAFREGMKKKESQAREGNGPSPKE